MGDVLFAQRLGAAIVHLDDCFDTRSSVSEYLPTSAHHLCVRVRGEAVDDRLERAEGKKVVGVQEADDVTGGQAHALVDRVVQARVRFRDHTRAGLVQQLQRPVGRATVDRHMLDRDLLLLAHARQRLREIGRRVERRSDERNPHELTPAAARSVASVASSDCLAAARYKARQDRAR